MPCRVFYLVNVITSLFLCDIFNNIFIDILKTSWQALLLGEQIHIKPKLDDLNYFLNCQSLHVSVCSLPQRSTQSKAYTLYWYTDYSFNRQSVHLSVCSSRGRSRYIDISLIYILSKFRYWFFVMARLYVMIGVCHSGDWCPSICI